MRGARAWGAAVPCVALVLASACSALDPVERDEGEAGITIRVVGCKADEVTGNVTMTYEVESQEKEYDVVLVEGRLKDPSGVVIGSSSGSVQNVVPGETYRQEMVLSPSGEPEGKLDCEAALDLATQPFG